jgi:hypothetical protein
MAATVAELGFAVDSAPLDKGTASLKAFNKEAQNTEVKLHEMDIRARTTSGGMERHATQITAVKNAMTQVVAQNTLASGSFGIITTALRSFGVAGVAIAGTLGVLAFAFHKAAEAALEMANKAGELRDFAETTTFTTTQIQALQKAGAEVGVSANSVSKGLEKFSFEMDNVKEATGPVYEQLLLMNPAIAKQISETTDLAEAWDLVAKAAKAGSQEQALVLSRQIFGRGGGGISRLLGASQEGGGLGKLTSDLNMLQNITEQNAKKFDDLGDSITKNMAAARTAIIQIFSGKVLELLNWASEKLLSAATSIAKIAAQSTDETQTRGGTRSPVAITVFPVATPEKTLEEARKAAIRAYNETKKWMEVLGDAATPAERLALKVKELDAAVAKNGESFRVYADRALAAFKSNEAMSALQARINLLGEEAKITDIVKLKRLEIEKANREAGAGITSRQAKNILEETKAVEEATRSNTILQVRAANGIVTADELMIQKQKELNIEVMKGHLTQQEANTSMSNYARHAKEAAEAAKVYGSSLPHLQSFINETANLNKQLDQVAIVGLSNMNNALLDFQMGTKSASEAMKEFGLQTIRTLLSMMNQMLILQPIALALKAALTGIGGGGGIGSLITGAAGAAGGGAGVGALGKLLGGGGGGGDKGVTVMSEGAFSPLDAKLDPSPSFNDTWNLNIEGAFRRGGLVGRDRGTPTWVHPAYFDNAPHFASGGMITDDGVPIIAHPGERVLSREETQSYGRGGGVNIGGTNIIIQGDASEKTVAMIDERIAARQREIPSIVIRTMQDAKSRRVGGV